MNSIRGNLEFGEVSHEAYQLPCSTSKMGAIPIAPGDYFEPPRDHKGNVARAIFYFSMRYGLTIDREEESYLRQWHQADPVDGEELARNDRIEEIQGNRNPFIDHPDLINQIANF
jgi:endonuclease I